MKMGFLRIVGICAVLCVFEVSGVDFTLNKDRVLLGSSGTLTMRCDISETDVDYIYLIEIQRIKSTTLSGSDPNDRQTLAYMELGANETPTLSPNIEAIAGTKDYVAGGSWDSSTPANMYLTLSMNMEKLVCDDASYYRCALSYKSTITGSVIIADRNSTFTAYVKPQVTSLIVKKNGFIVQGMSSFNMATAEVGDELELTCTANIGSLPETLIRWHRTSETSTSNDLIDYQPPQGTFDEGNATSDNQCGYTRVASIRYNATASDACRDNYLAFECFVTVTGDPYGNSYTSENNPRFYTDVFSGEDFTISRERVLLGSSGTLTMRCDISETDVDSIYLIKIQRFKSTTLSGSNYNDWQTLALMEAGTNVSPWLTQDIAAVADSKDYVAGGSWDATTPANTYLTLSMNMEKLVCDDARYYRCELTYKSTITGSVMIADRNSTFSAYVKPQVTSLVVRKNGNTVERISPFNMATADVGDEFELTCTANIGSLPETLIRWQRTSETSTSDDFIGYQPPKGTFEEGTAISDNQCGYTRVASIRYKVTAADANRDNNLAFECYITVSGDPYGNSYTSENNPRFSTDVTDTDGGNTGESVGTAVTRTTSSTYQTLSTTASTDGGNTGENVGTAVTRTTSSTYQTLSTTAGTDGGNTGGNVGTAVTRTTSSTYQTLSTTVTRTTSSTYQTLSTTGMVNGATAVEMIYSLALVACLLACCIS